MNDVVGLENSSFASSVDFFECILFIPLIRIYKHNVVFAKEEVAFFFNPFSHPFDSVDLSKRPSFCVGYKIP